MAAKIKPGKDVGGKGGRQTTSGSTAEIKPGKDVDCHLGRSRMVRIHAEFPLAHPLVRPHMISGDPCVFSCWPQVDF